MWERKDKARIPNITIRLRISKRWASKFCYFLQTTQKEKRS